MNSHNRPKSSVKKRYSVDSKNERILLDMENEEKFKNEGISTNNLKSNQQNEIIEMFRRQKEKLTKIELLDKNEGQIYINFRREIRLE